MKSINALTVLLMFFFFAIAVTAAGPAYAGDYYIYKDRNGALVISNNAPPPDTKLIKKETLSEVTDRQIAESQITEATTGFDNRMSSLEKSIDELKENLRVPSQVTGPLREGDGDTNIAVGVTQTPTIIAKPPRKPIRHPTKSKSNLSGKQFPAARCCERAG